MQLCNGHRIWLQHLVVTISVLVVSNLVVSRTYAQFTTSFFDNNGGTGNGQWETATNWNNDIVPNNEAWISDGYVAELNSQQSIFKFFAGQDERESGVIIKPGGRLETFQEAVVGGGHGGNGSMTIQPGALGWIVRGQARVGGSDNQTGVAQGTLVVNGGASEFRQDFNVGMDGGTGTATINGGTILEDRVLVGRNYMLNVGPNGQPSTGTFTISPGVTVTAKSYFAAGIFGSGAGMNPGGHGTLNVSGTLDIIGGGADLYYFAGDLRIGIQRRAIGELNVTGGTINVANDVTIAHETGVGTGIFNGDFNITNNFYIGYGFDPAINPEQPFTTLDATGSFTVNGGTVDLGGTLGVGMGAGIASTITGILTINGGTVTAGGPLVLGDEFGSTGRVELNGGTLKVADADIDQLVAQQNQVIIDGGATFAMPDSRASLLNNLIASGNVVAAPGATLSAPVVGAGMVMITATSQELSGDFNQDGRVDAADYVHWRKNGLSQQDYNTWRANFGASTGSGSITTQAGPIPEPISMIYGFIGALYAAGVRVASRKLNIVAEQVD
jgi:hypothetical protein